MALIDFVDALPEDKREAYKSEISKAVVIASKEDALKLVETNELIKGVNQADRDRRYNEMLDKFNKEKLPQLLEEERKKGQKQPWEIEIENLKKENETAKRESALEKQKSRAMAKASELGLPVALVEKYVGLTDEETDAGLKFLADTVIPYRDGAVKAELAKIGKQGSPNGGRSPAPQDLQTQYAEAVKAGNGVEMLRLKGLMQASASSAGA